MAMLQDYLTQVQTMLVNVQADSDAMGQKITDLNTQLVAAQDEKTTDDEVVALLTDLVEKLQALFPVSPVVPPTVEPPVDSVPASTVYTPEVSSDYIPVRMGGQS